MENNQIQKEMLISDIDAFKKFIPTIAGDDFERYAHHLMLADEWLQTEIIGDALFDRVSQNDELNKLLLDKCQAVVAHKGYLTAVPFLDLIETNNGFAVVSSQSNLAPASTARVQSLTAGIEKALTERVDRLLEYLEKTAIYHDDWKSSKTYSLTYDSYLFTMNEFRRYADFPGTRMDFIRAKAKMRIVIVQNIEPMISPELSDEIIEQLRDGDLSDSNNKIIELIRFAFANFVVDNNYAAENFIAKVRRILMKSPDDFPTFKMSDLYARIIAPGSYDGSNSPFLVCQ